jgi:hypothetical protein
MSNIFLSNLIALADLNAKNCAPYYKTEMAAASTADVVVALWPDDLAPSGYGITTVKGQEIVELICATGTSEALVIAAIHCIDQTAASLMRFELKRRGLS